MCPFWFKTRAACTAPGSAATLPQGHPPSRPYPSKGKKGQRWGGRRKGGEGVFLLKAIQCSEESNIYLC